LISDFSCITLCWNIWRLMHYAMLKCRISNILRYV